MDQSIIRSLKAYYHHSLIKCHITSIDGGSLPANVKMLEAMTLLPAAWECVSQETLVNCLKKAKISSEKQVRSQSEANLILNCLMHSSKFSKTDVNLHLFILNMMGTLMQMKIRC